MARLALSLLGALEIKVDETPVTDRLYRKGRALLAYLAIEAGRPHRRDSLAALLWPDWPERSARTNLRNTLSDLRAVVGDRDAQTPCLLVTRETIQFNEESDLWLDVTAFRAALEAGSPSPERQEEALALYRGPFLDGFSVEDSVSYEGWTQRVREWERRQAGGATGAPQPER